MVICPFAPYGLAHGLKNCKICHKLGPDFVDRISLKPLDGCTPLLSFMDLSRPVVVHCHSCLPICPIWVCPWAKNLSSQAALGPDFAEPIYLKPLDGFIPFEVLWNCLDLYLCNIRVIWPWPLIFKIKFCESAVSQEWEGRLAWNERDVSR